MNRQLYQFGTEPGSTSGIGSLQRQFVTGPNSPEQLYEMDRARQAARRALQKLSTDPVSIIRDLYNTDVESYRRVLGKLNEFDPRQARQIQQAVEESQEDPRLQEALKERFDPKTRENLFILPRDMRESQDVPEYYDPRLQILDPEQMQEEMQNPSMPMRDMRMGGGIMSLTPRSQYGFGSKFFKSAKKAVKGVVDAVKKVADPVAQVLAVVPNPYQPYAQMYTAARSSGLGGKDYGGLQIAGFTPGAYGGTYGINPMQSPFKIPGGSSQVPGTFGFPQSGGNEGIFSLGNIFDSNIGNTFDANITGGNEEGNFLEKVLDSVTKQISDDPLGALKELVKIGGSAYAGYTAKKDQERINRLKQEAYDRYMAGVAAKRGQYSGKTPLQRIEVTGVPTRSRDVVRAPAAYGGRMNYALGSVDEGIMAAPQIANMMGMPVGNPRQNQQGVAELDYRDVGGFVPPIGIKEKADDIPAMLSNNEFVFTANAVKNADPSGNRDPEEGAKVMYRTMKMLENGGMV